MQTRFGHDFSRVRVFSDEQAAQSASAVNARAYTFGPNIVFNAGQYQPGSNETDRLLAHELTHVVQQGMTGPNATGTSGMGLGALPDELEISDPSDAGELEATRTAEGVMGGARAEVGLSTGLSVQRDLWDTLKKWGSDGVPLGKDWNLKPKPESETDDRYDTPENRRRAEAKEAEERGEQPTPPKWWEPKPPPSAPDPNNKWDPMNWPQKQKSPEFELPPAPDRPPKGDFPLPDDDDAFA